MIACIDAVPLQARHEMLEYVAIAEAAKTGQHHLEEHVLRQQHPVAEAHIDEGADCAGVLLVGRRLGILVGIVIVHADHVVFEKGAAPGEACLIVKILMAGVHVAEHGVLQVGAFLLDDVEHLIGQPLPAGQVDRQRHAGDAGSACRGAQGFPLLGGEILADADFADNAGHDLGLASRRRRHH